MGYTRADRTRDWIGRRDSGYAHGAWSTEVGARHTTGSGDGMVSPRVQARVGLATEGEAEPERAEPEGGRAARRPGEGANKSLNRE